MFTMGEQLYEQFITDLYQRRYLNGAHGLEENPFTRWSKLCSEEQQSWEEIARRKL